MQKNIGVFDILTFEMLTKRKLTTSLVLNNRAQIVIVFIDRSWINRVPVCVPGVI